MELAVTGFLALDGVSQGPGAPDEDTSGGFARGGWLVPHIDERFVALAVDWLAAADGLLLGRRTYEIFEQSWPHAADPEDPFAETMNALPKYVASNTLRTADRWRPTTILSGDAAAQVRELKQRPGRELQIHGSARLAGAMLAAGLVDTLRLVVAPVVVGAGRRLFPDTGPPVGLQLAHCETTPAGAAVLVYRAAGAPGYGEYRVET
ncbi:dihydrofolate reductase family protein [Streptomonospora sediminis]